MMRHALISPLNVIDRFAENVDPTVQTKTGWKWLEAPRVARPTYDPELQAVEGPNYVIGPTSVTESYTVRNFTAQELSDRKDAKVNDLDKVILQVLFNHENRIRTLAGQPSVTIQQFLTAIRALI